SSALVPGGVSTRGAGPSPLPAGRGGDEVGLDDDVDDGDDVDVEGGVEALGLENDPRFGSRALARSGVADRFLVGEAGYEPTSFGAHGGSVRAKPVDAV